MSQTHYYEVNVQWKEGRIGELSSPILEKTIECATPPEFSNGVPNIWSPEHLFVAAINSWASFSENVSKPAEDTRMSFWIFLFCKAVIMATCPPME